MNPYDTRDLACLLSVADDQAWDNYGATTETAPALRQQRDPGPNHREGWLMNETIEPPADKAEQARQIRMFYSALCGEGVVRGGEFQPCDKPTVAYRLDPEEGTPYAVCARHCRADMVSLADVLCAAGGPGVLA